MLNNLEICLIYVFKFHVDVVHIPDWLFWFGHQGRHAPYVAIQYPPSYLHHKRTRSSEP
jgi:hypothetical protein